MAFSYSIFLLIFLICEVQWSEKGALLLHALTERTIHALPYSSSSSPLHAPLAFLPRSQLFMSTHKIARSPTESHASGRLGHANASAHNPHTTPPRTISCTLYHRAAQTHSTSLYPLFDKEDKDRVGRGGRDAVGKCGAVPENEWRFYLLIPPPPQPAYCSSRLGASSEFLRFI